MHLVVTRYDTAIGGDQKRPIDEPGLWRFGFQSQRPGQNPQPQITRRDAQTCKNGVFGLWIQDGRLMGAIQRDAIANLWCQGDLRALILGLVQHVLHQGEVPDRIVRRSHL